MEFLPLVSSLLIEERIRDHNIFRHQLDTFLAKEIGRFIFGHFNFYLITDALRTKISNTLLTPTKHELE